MSGFAVRMIAGVSIPRNTTENKTNIAIRTFFIIPLLRNVLLENYNTEKENLRFFLRFFYEFAKMTEFLLLKFLKLC